MVVGSLDGAARSSSPGSRTSPVADAGSDPAQACPWALGGDRRNAAVGEAVQACHPALDAS
eukprot:10902358-Alexandrium_andersonii.AAC.1